MISTTVVTLKRLLAWSAISDVRIELARIKTKVDDKATFQYGAACRGCLLDAPDRTIDRLILAAGQAQAHVDDHRAQNHRIPEPGGTNAVRAIEEFLR